MSTSWTASWKTKALAGVAGVNLSLALAVAAGAVPHPGADGTVHAASIAQVAEPAAAAARQPGDAAPTRAAAAAATAAPQAAQAAQATTTVAKPKTTTPPTTKAPARTTTTKAPATIAAAPAPAAAATPTTVAKVPRRTPTAAEVQSVISELKRQVGGILLLVSPTPAQIDQAGDQVCTAFDNGQTFAQVKATGLSMIPSSITVSPATADWAVRQAVTLYCPGHANKLV